MNYYNHHIGDFIRDAGHLDLIEEAIYRRLIDLYYLDEKPLAEDVGKVAKRIRAKDQIEAVKAVLEEFFLPVNSGWKHKRCERELRDYREKAEKNRKNGAKGGRPKRPGEPLNTGAKTQSVISGLPDGNPNERQPIASNQEPRTNNPPKPPEGVPGAGPPDGGKAGAISGTMKRFGIRSNPSDPRVIELVNQGVLPTTVQAACEEAKNAKGDEGVSLGYVVGILNRWSKDAEKVSAGNANPRPADQVWAGAK